MAAGFYGTILRIMTRNRFYCAVVVVGVSLAFHLAHAQKNTIGPAPSAAGRIDTAFQKFWAARSPEEAAKTVNDVVKSGVTFDDAWQRLKRGRTYKAQKPGIVMLMNRTSDGLEHYYAVTVPPGYDPNRRYQVRFQLHGGVGGRSDNKPRNSGDIGALAGAEQIYVIPYSWESAPWWSEDQVLNVNSIADELKRTYNVDENRVVVAGVSDGGTGAYYIAMHETTPFASFLPLNGFIMVLADSGIDHGNLFPNNLVNKPMFVINGGQDRLYPLSIVEPFVNHMIGNNVEITYHPHPEAGHNTAWWPEEKDAFEKFVVEHPRQPHPDKLTWEIADFPHNRAHWLVIDQLGSQAGNISKLPDVNVVENSDEIAELDPSLVSLFRRTKPSGRVDVVRTGNTIQAKTKGVTAFTILLSPDTFDFGQPIKVIANGQNVFEGRVEKNLETLMTWAAHDNDRTMLYAAELNIKY